MATVQIRNLDDEAYGVLKARAAASGRSLQEYLRLLLEKEAQAEERETFWSRYRADMSWTSVSLAGDEIVDAVRKGRDERASELGGVTRP